MKELHGNVLIIVENLPVPFDRRVWMESTTLKENGAEVSVICPKGKGYEKEYEVIDGIHIYRHPLPPEESSAKGYIREYSHALYHEFRLARKIYQERGFDVIHACNPPDLIFLLGLWFKIFKGTKFLFDHHDLNPELYESKFGKRGLFYHLLGLAEKCTFKTADYVISTNQSYKKVAIERGSKKPDDVHIVRSGPDLDFFNPVEPEKSYKRGKDCLIGYLGVMGEFDGVDNLIEAANILVNERNRADIQFCLIGSGPCLEELKELTKKYNLQENVEFTGRIPDKELIDRLSSCDVCVNPDPMNPLNDKSTMNKILEYMALKKPIVQFDLLEGRRSAENASLYAKPGDVSDLADKIIELLKDPSKREKMGKIGRYRMEKKLEWKYQKKKLLNVYNKILS